MNEAANGVGGDQSEEPEHDQNDGNGG